MGWYYDDNNEPVPQHLQPKGQWVYDDTNQPVPHDLVPGNVPFPPGWRGQAMGEMAKSFTSEGPTIHGIFDAPDPGVLNPTAQRLEDYLTRKVAPIEQALPEWVQPIVHPIVQPATPTEALVSGIGAVGTGLQGLEWAGAPESLGLTAAMIPATRLATSATQLGGALVGGALEARPGHRIESAENEAIKTGLGLVLAHTLHIPYVRRLAKPLAPWLRIFAPAVGRVGTPAVLTGGSEAVRRVVERLNPVPAIMEGGGEGGGEGGESSAP
jgi:hypothetical protein